MMITQEKLIELLKEAAQRGIETGLAGTNVDNTPSGIAATVYMNSKCQYASCDYFHTITYQDKARKIWKLCAGHRADAARRKI